MKAAGKTVTVTLSKDNFMPPPLSFQEGQKIKLGRNSWFIAPHRIKTKQMIHRLLKKEYYPYLIIKKAANGYEQTTLTVKPYNF